MLTKKNKLLKSAYLSIDLDFWMYEKNTDSANEFFHVVLNSGLPITVVEEHHQLLPDIDKSKCNVLYNVDFHSDLCCKRKYFRNKDPTVLDEGTWVGFVRQRRHSEYIWIVPDVQTCVKDGSGLCDEEHRYRSKRDPFTYPSLHQWKKVSFTEGIETIKSDLSKEGKLSDSLGIARIGVSLSPTWVCVPPVRHVLLDLAKRFPSCKEAVSNLTSSPA